MSLINLIKRLKPRHYTTLHIEFPITLPRDCTPNEYEYLSSAEIESKALAVHTAIVNTCGITPKRLRGTIVPDITSFPTPRDKIVITCRVPEDAPIVLIGDDCIQIPGSNCMFFA